MSGATQEATARPDAQDGESFAATLQKAMVRRLMVGIAASGATAATAYLVRKGRELWDEQAVPRIEERGGLDAVAKEAVSKASEWIESAPGKVAESAPVSAVVEKATDTEVTDVDATGTQEPAIEPVENVSDPKREAERRERRKRREARQRALERAKTA